MVPGGCGFRSDFRTGGHSTTAPDPNPDAGANAGGEDCRAAGAATMPALLPPVLGTCDATDAAAVVEGNDWEQLTGEMTTEVEIKPDGCGPACAGGINPAGTVRREPVVGASANGGENTRGGAAELPPDGASDGATELDCAAAEGAATEVIPVIARPYLPPPVLARVLEGSSKQILTRGTE